MYQHDFEISKHLLSLMEKYDWPQNIEISTPKNKKEKILEIDTLLKNRIEIALSQQSMNRTTLKEIKRENLTNIEYLEFVKELEVRRKPAVCELIIPLPGGSEETYHAYVRILADNGVFLGTYTLMMLCGNELGRRETREKFGLKTRCRVLPRQFGEYRGKIF
jgi:radical SAM superfamily enzyme